MTPLLPTASVDVSVSELRERYRRADLEDRRRDALRIAGRLSARIAAEAPEGLGFYTWAWTAVAQADTRAVHAMKAYEAGGLSRERFIDACAALRSAWTAAGNHYRNRQRGENDAR